MDNTNLKDIADFLHDALKVQRDVGEFTRSEFAHENHMALSTVRELLSRAEIRGLVESRKTPHGKFYKICNEEEWQKWLNQRNNIPVSKK